MKASFSLRRKIAGLVFCATGVSSFAQSSGLYAVPTDEGRKELAAWGQLYVNTLNGAPISSEAEKFSFSRPEFNSPYFSPVYAALRTVGKISSIAACDTSATITEANLKAFESYLIQSELATSLSDPLLIAHVNAVTDAPPDSKVSVVVSGSEFLSIGLPPLSVTANSASGTAVVPVSSDRSSVIADISAFGQKVALALNDGDPQRRLITGKPSLGSEFADAIRAFTTSSIKDETIVREMVVLFGRYGAVPVIEVAFPSDEVYVLVDAVQGKMSGPFAMGTAFDASTLLQSVPDYEPGSPAEFALASTGCPAVADTKTPVVPVTPLPTPGPALPPGVTPLPGTPTGKPNGWQCQDMTGPPPYTACWTEYNYVGPCAVTPPPVVTVPGGCLYKLKINCTSTPALIVPWGTPPKNITPAPPTTVPNPPAPLPLAPATCTYEIYYWS